MRKHLFYLTVCLFTIFSLNTLEADSSGVNMKETVQEFEQQSQADIEAAKMAFEKLQHIDGPKSVSTVLDPLNNLLILIDRRINRSTLYQAVHPDPAMRQTAEKIQQELSKLDTDIHLSRPLYEAIKAVDVSAEDQQTQFHVKKLLKNFERAGVDRDEATREKIRRLEDELVRIGQEFAKNIRSDIRTIYLNSVDELAGLPKDYIENHKPGKDGKIAITTDYPDYIPFISYAKSDTRRKELYIQYRQRGYPKNIAVLKNLLTKRYELAQTLGYRDYAQYITENKMIRTPEAAKAFIDRVANIAARRAEADYAELLTRLQKENPAATEVGDWQKSYIGQLVKKESYNFDAQELRPYFPYKKVRDGLLNLTSRLFGVSFRPVEVPVWHPSVEAYEMWIGDELRGRFYLDMHPRQDKYKHAMMTEVVTGVRGQQLPEAALVCNFPGGDGSAGLMEHDQVETFFHEFGHLLHHLLAGNQRWIGISGITTEWDFVETPSILLQEWAWNTDILQSFAVNENGETIPAELIEKMRKARKFRLGIDIRQQMYYAAISLNFYNRDPHSFDPMDFVVGLQTKYTPFKYVPDTYMHLAFGHLNGYSAIYYTYMWSQVIAKDLFSVFEKDGLLNTETARCYRKTVLEPGGSDEAANLVHNFLGRDYSFDAFEHWLNE